MPGTTENCKCDYRQQHRVKPGDHRSADNFSVTHHLRDAEGGENDPAHNIARKIGLVERKKTLEQRQALLRVARLLRLLDVAHAIPSNGSTPAWSMPLEHRRLRRCNLSNESRSK